MQLVDARVTHYRSINDSGVVGFDPEITGIVGAVGSGKTSFLTMLSGVSAKVRFGEADLPRNSGMLARLRGGSARAGEIVQLQATFRVEDADRRRLPPEHRRADRIEVRRTLAGAISLSVDGEALPRVDIRREADAIRGHAERAAGVICPPGRGGRAGGAALAERVAEAASCFRDADYYDERWTALAAQSLRNAALSADVGRGALDEFESELAGIDSVRGDIARKIQADPQSAVYRAVPKPLYCGGVFELEDGIDLDRFIADPFGSRTFSCVAQACGLTPAGISRVRHAPPAERDGYLSKKSAMLGARLGQFWRQEDYAFRLAIDGSRLLLGVSDRTTGTATPPSERSSGFRWMTAFFLDIAAFVARRPGRCVILLDNPATELHEGGKGDVLRFMREAARSGRIQVVYSTHERALVDPRRADRVRVACLTADGTKIRTIGEASRGGPIEAAMGGAGSPAQYSMFGAQRTVVFEEDSDMYAASAVNEYIARTDPGASLDRDVYSISSMGGMAMAEHALAMYRGMGADFVMVVGRGRASEAAAGEAGAAESGRRIVEIPAADGRSEAGIEDLVDRSLYYEAFREAYRGRLDRVPSIDEIDSGGGQRRADRYRSWLEGAGHGYGRTLVALRMFGVVLDDEAARADPGRAEALKRTSGAFASLFASIKARCGGAEFRGAPRAAP